MSTKICFAYPWATFGGCERVFINRAIAFKKYFPGVKIDFLFLSDGGGLRNFVAALKKYHVDDIASIVSSLHSSYQFVSLVDCPQLIGKLRSANQRYIVECHTGYVENRRYLSTLPVECRFVAAPSSRFREKLSREFPSIQVPILELPNFVPWDIEEYKAVKEFHFPEWTRRPILFLGRMDNLKDPISLLDAFELIEKRREGEFMLLLCGPRSVEIDIEREISKRGLYGNTVLLPPIPFHAASTLMDAVRKAGGIFVSPSRSESFGLSVAEAISSLLPPALSNIDAHLDLIGDFEDLYTFPLGNTNSLADRIEYLLDNHLSTQDVLRKMRDNFSATRFVISWERLFNEAQV